MWVKLILGLKSLRCKLTHSVHNVMLQLAHGEFAL